MKLLVLLLALPIICFGQNVNIPDANFKAYLVNNKAINTNGDKEIQVSEASAFTDTIDCSGLNISNLNGIEAFTALTTLYCGSNNYGSNQLTSLDVSKNNALSELYCGGNKLTSLDVSKNTVLWMLTCDNNQLKSLDVSKNTALEWLYCDGNKLTSLDVSKNTALTALYCNENHFDCASLKRKYGLE